MRVEIVITFFKYSGKQFFPRLIKWWTNSEYYHTEVSINGTWITSTTEYGVGVSNTPVYGGVTTEHKITTDMTLTQYNDMLAWAYSKKDKSYDYTGIVMSQVLPARIDNPNKWFCSEIVTKILQLALISKTYDLTPNMISPGGLAKVFGVEK